MLPSILSAQVLNDVTYIVSEVLARLSFAHIALKKVGRGLPDDTENLRLIDIQFTLFFLFHQVRTSWRVSCITNLNIQLNKDSHQLLKSDCIICKPILYATMVSYKYYDCVLIYSVQLTWSSCVSFSLVFSSPHIKSIWYHFGLRFYGVEININYLKKCICIDVLICTFVSIASYRLILPGTIVNTRRLHYLSYFAEMHACTTGRYSSWAERTINHGPTRVTKPHLRTDNDRWVYREMKATLEMIWVPARVPRKGQKRTRTRKLTHITNLVRDTVLVWCPSAWAHASEDPREDPRKGSLRSSAFLSTTSKRFFSSK